MEIKRKEEWKQIDGTYKCPICNENFKKNGICSHIWRAHDEKGTKHRPTAIFIANGGQWFSWNKGLSKENDIRLKMMGECLSNKYKTEIHPSIGTHHTEATKLNLSIKMKLAHKEGRAWNIGMSRWKNKASYPETFFMKVIENEFENKNYKREFNVGIFSIDFAWEDKKLAIEIDGDQHQRFEEVKQRDLRKDAYLIENGWKILRIKWIDMFHFSKEWIKIAKDFINDN